MKQIRNGARTGPYPLYVELLKSTQKKVSVLIKTHKKRISATDFMYI